MSVLATNWGTDLSAEHPSDAHQHQSPPRPLYVDYLQPNQLKPDGFWGNTFIHGTVTGLISAQQQLSTAFLFWTIYS